MIARVATILAVGALAAIGMGGSLIVGGIAWLAALFFIASGWGFLVARSLRVDDPDFGLRAAWGLAGYLAVAGVLLAIGVCARPAILALLGVGFAGFAWRELVAPAPLWRSLRTEPAVAIVAVGIVALASYKLLGAVAQLDRHPWDDDIAYTPLVKRLLDLGDLLEPFCFRRLGAYGGQTVLQALAGARGTLDNVHLIDKGLCQGLCVMLVFAHARARGASPLWVALASLILLLIPEIAINTASYWSGLLCFLALYRTVALERWTVAGLVGAATCTLRMNYLAPTVLFLVIALALRRDRRAWLQTALAGVLALLPYMIAGYLASQTFLFPIMEGTWNHGLSLRQGDPTAFDELRFFAWCAIDTAPIVVWPLLALAIAFTRDERKTRPLTALAIAGAIGIALLAHSLVGSDPSNVWRYAFAFTTALVAMTVAELGGELDTGPIRLPPLGRWLVLACLGLQLMAGRGAIAKELAAIAANLRESTVGNPAARVEAQRYAALQAALPVGASAAVMLDDPYLLDYGRNQLFNLDTPGFASPGTQLPAFEGPEALRTYLRAEGIDYLVFVRPEASRYFYRREHWVQRLFTDTELFQAMGAYTIDLSDSCVALASSHPVRFDRDGLVVVDLGGPTAPMPTAAPEVERRSAWVKALAETRGLHDAWTLIPRPDVRFEDGFGNLVFIDPRDDDARWNEVMHHVPPAPLAGTAARWVQRRAHARVRGGGRMHLIVRGVLNINALATHPRLLLALDGVPVRELTADADGRFSVDTTVSADDGWHELYLVFSSVGEPDRDLRDLRTARVEVLEWSR